MSKSNPRLSNPATKFFDEIWILRKNWKHI